MLPDSTSNQGSGPRAPPTRTRPAPHAGARARAGASERSLIRDMRPFRSLWLSRQALPPARRRPPSPGPSATAPRAPRGRARASGCERGRTGDQPPTSDPARGGGARECDAFWMSQLKTGTLMKQQTTRDNYMSLQA
jgi:hypothetical protein